MYNNINIPAPRGAALKVTSSPRARFDDNILYIYIKTCIATAYDKNMYTTEDYSHKRSLAIKQCRKGGSTLARIFPDLADSIPKVPPPMRQLKYKFRRDKVDMVVADRKYAVLGSCQEVHLYVLPVQHNPF